MVTVEVSWDTEPFGPVELYSGDSLEIAGHLVMTLWRIDCMLTAEVSWNMEHI